MEQAERYLRASPQLRGKLQGSYEDLFFKNIVKIKNKDFFFSFFLLAEFTLASLENKTLHMDKKKTKNSCKHMSHTEQY